MIIRVCDVRIWNADQPVCTYKPPAETLAIQKREREREKTKQGHP
jgi:hypothetical protein